MRLTWIILLAVCLAIAGEVRADALSAPPSATRMIIFNSVDGSVLTNTAQTVNLTSLAGGQSTKSMLIGNDAPLDATGDSDLLVNMSGSVAAVPTNGITGSSTLRIFPQHEYNIDGQFSTLSIRSRTSGIPIHIFISY